MLQLGFHKFIAYTTMNDEGQKVMATMKNANPNPTNPISDTNPNITHNRNSEQYNLFLTNKNPIGQHCFKSALAQAETKNKQQDTKATTRHVHPRAAHSACLLTSHTKSHFTYRRSNFTPHIIMMSRLAPFHRTLTPFCCRNNVMSPCVLDLRLASEWYTVS